MALKMKVLVNFSFGNGPQAPLGDLILDANGNLLGTTAEGGQDNAGTVFEIANTATGYASVATTLVSFNGSDGSFPTDSLIFDANGNLFGTTAEGGQNNAGTVFEIAKTAAGYASMPTTLVFFSFHGDNGASPSGSLIIDANGNLLGTTDIGGGAQGNGTVFEIAKTATGYATAPTTLVSFDRNNGAFPLGSLIIDANGNLLGTTDGGGAQDNGTVFEIAKTATGYASTPTTLVSFDRNNGANPFGSLIADANGNLFGTTAEGGLNNAGTVFEIASTATGYASTPTTLVDFDFSNGASPRGSLIADAQGDLFGTTSSGGTGASGTVFEIVKTATGYAPTPRTLVNFDGGNGAYPSGSLIADAQGDLFGTTGHAVTSSSSGTVFEITDSGFVICFAQGTQIATPTGETPVERLSVGDTVLTADGKVEPIIWIGVGRVLVTPGRRSAATPVTVHRGALADNVPHRDLRVTKGHSLFIDDVLIPVEFLINHRSICWDDRAREVDVYHVELAKHGVLIADGAAAESYRDDGNRWLFRNANSGWGLPPQPPCAPVLTGGPIVDAIWRRLLSRAGPRPGFPTTADPDLHLLVDGRRVNSEARPDGVHLFHLAEYPASVRIVSHAAAPQELGLARDPRCLGVALRRIVMRQQGKFRVVDAADASLVDGFHDFEADGGFRWTDGDAVMPTELFAEFKGPVEIVLTVAGTTRYIETGVRQQAA
jgi:hypothetical protein